MPDARRRADLCPEIEVGDGPEAPAQRTSRVFPLDSDAGTTVGRGELTSAAPRDANQHGEERTGHPDLRDALARAEAAVVAAEAGVEVLGARVSMADVAIASVRALARLAGIAIGDAEAGATRPVRADASSSGQAERVARERSAAPLYYSLTDLPPQTSARAFRRALRSGLPTTRVGYAEVVTPTAWLAWVEGTAKPRRRSPLSAAPTDDEILASPGARRGARRAK